MRAVEFITERVVEPYSSTPISTGLYGDPNAVAKILMEKCSDMVDAAKSGHFIYRGFKETLHDADILDPSTGRRASQNTSNYYTEIMSNSQYYNGWPKRDRSFICSTGHHYAGAFGRTYRLFPFNGSVIAILPERDLWECPIDASAFRLFRHFTPHDLNVVLSGWRVPPHYELMAQHFQTKEFKEYYALSDSAETMPAEKILAHIEKMLSPSGLGAVKETTATYKRWNYNDKECWFSAPCVAVEDSFWTQSVSPALGA